MAETSNNLIIRLGSVFEASASGTIAIAALLTIVLAMVAYGCLRRRM